MGGFRPLVESAPLRAACALLLVAVVSTCRSGSDPVDPAWLPGVNVDLSTPMRPFDGATALEDAERLARMERKSPDARGAARARTWIAEQLHAMGARTGRAALAPVVTSEPGSPEPEEDDGAESDALPRPVVGVLPGESADVILLAATYDPLSAPPTDERGWVDATSGAAVLLELGRALAARPRLYTVWLAFVDDPLDEPPMEDAAGRPPLDRVRLAVFFESLARPDLRVVRDLRSHRVHREAFWDSARALGLEAVFVPDAPFDSPEGAHRTLLDDGFRAAVALVGESPRRLIDDDDATEPVDDERFATETAARLDELGTVVLDALDGIATRLDRIDGFSAAPLSSERWEDGPATGHSGDGPPTRPDEPPASKPGEERPAAGSAPGMPAQGGAAPVR